MRMKTADLSSLKLPELSHFETRRKTEWEANVFAFFTGLANFFLADFKTLATNQVSEGLFLKGNINFRWYFMAHLAKRGAELPLEVSASVMRKREIDSALANSMLFS